MNTTLQQENSTELMPLDGELLTDDNPKKKRASPYQYDQAYIEAFIANPHLGKTAAMKVAVPNVTSHIRKRAHELHARLEPQINELLRQKVLSCTHFGMNVLYELAAAADSQAVRGHCASKLIELGLRVAPPTPQKIETRTREQILKEIKDTRRRINDMNIGTKV